MDSMVRGNIGSSPWSLSMMTESIQIAISFGFYLPVMGICCCSVAKSCLTLCNQADCSTPGSSVLRYLPELAQIHVHWVSDAIQPSHPLLSHSLLSSVFPSIRVFSIWDGSSHQVANVLELQHQSFQLILRIDFLQDWLVWSPCSPRGSQESFPVPQRNVILFWSLQPQWSVLIGGRTVDIMVSQAKVCLGGLV